MGGDQDEPTAHRTHPLPPPPKTKNDPAQNVNSVEAEKPCSYHFVCVIAFNVLSTPIGQVLSLPHSTDKETEE